MDIMTWLTENVLGQMSFTAIVSMVPVLELRGGIPFGVTLGLTHFQALLASVIGNLIPLPFIVVYIRRVFKWMRTTFPVFGNAIDKLEKKAHL